MKTEEPITERVTSLVAWAIMVATGFVLAMALGNLLLKVIRYFV